MSYNNQRTIDAQNELAMAEFLHEVIYKNLMIKFPTITSATRAESAAMQIAGVDTTLSIGSKQVYIDEKSQMHQINAMLPTQAFELAFTGKTSRIGWFLAEDSKTDFYLISYPFSSVQNTTRQTIYTAESFSKVYCLLINKKKLKAKLAELGFSDSELFRWVQKIEMGEVSGIRAATGLRFLTETPGVRLFYSTAYPEKPINLVLSRTLLNTVAKCEIVADRKSFSIQIPGTNDGMPVRVA